MYTVPQKPGTYLRHKPGDTASEVWELSRAGWAWHHVGDDTPCPYAVMLDAQSEHGFAWEWLDLSVRAEL